MSISSLESFIEDFDEKTFRSNVEQMVDYEVWFHKIPDVNHKQIGAIWEALTDYYIDYLYHQIDAYQTQDKVHPRLKPLDDRKTALMCHNIYDHYKRRINNEIK